MENSVRARIKAASRNQQPASSIHASLFTPEPYDGYVIQRLNIPSVFMKSLKQYFTLFFKS
jgi:hypothetical protein